MLAKSVRHDPWSITVGLLGLTSKEGTPPRPGEAPATLREGVFRLPASSGTKAIHKAANNAADNATQRCRPTVVVLDRPSTMTVTVQWCDATSGRYGDQIWRAGVSRANAVCVLSGKRINAGDAIYRPRACGQSPLNAGEMILASSIEGVLRC